MPDATASVDTEAIVVGVGQDHVHCHLVSRSAAFLHGKRLHCAFNAS